MKLRTTLAATLLVIMLGVVLPSVSSAATVPINLKNKLATDGQSFIKDDLALANCGTIPCQEKWLFVGGHAALALGSDEKKIAAYVPAGFCRSAGLSIANDTSQFGRLELRLRIDDKTRNISDLRSVVSKVSTIKSKLLKAENVAGQCQGVAN